jgi:fructokinase
MQGGGVQDVLVIGEALVDIVSAPGQSPVEHAGGSPANVALGLARLGVTTQLLTRIGSDERGRLIRRHLEASGVRLVDGSVTAEPTSTATAHLDPAGVASYEFDLLWALPANANTSAARAVHTGSIAATLPPGGGDVLRLIEAVGRRSLVSYDPNARPALMGDPRSALERIERLVRASDVVKVSDEDLEWLLPGVDPLQVAETWRASGPALVVVTRGGAGATGVLASGVVEVPAPKILVADTVGAGDALMAGLLDGLDGAGLLRPDRVEDLRAATPAQLAPLLSHAVHAAALTCTRPGANPPTREELEHWSRTASSE